MIGFRPLAQLGLLGFDEIPDFRSFSHEHMRTKVRKRPDLSVVSDLRIAQHAVIENFNPAADDAISNSRP